MATAVSRLPSHLQPRTKAAATTSSLPQPPKPPSPVNDNRPKYTAAQITEAVSDKATVSLIRRVLCSATADKNATISEMLPPLTSSNEVDLQVYGIVAVIMREFVYAWYSKITPDQVFVDEIVKVIAHVTRGLEQRIRKVDLEALLFDELPELLEAHVTAYRAAHYPLNPPPYEADPRLIYHSLWPNPALSPVPDSANPLTIALQKENEAAYRDLLVQGMLAILLPTEDLENDCLTSLVGGILSDMIIGNGIGGKASEPWLLWEGITHIIEVVQEQLAKTKKKDNEGESSTEIEEPKEEATDTQTSQARIGWQIQKTFWLVLQYAFIAFTTARLIIFTIASSSSLPTRGKQFVEISTNTSAPSQLQPPPSPYSTRSFSSQLSTSKQVAKQPIISMKIWPCVSMLIDLGVRIPWLCTTLSLFQWGALHGPGHIGGTDGRVDKLIHTHFTLRVLNPAILPQALRSVRAALFPNNMPGPARIPPTPEETIRIKRKCAESILGMVPLPIRKVYFGKGDRGEEDDRHRQISEVEEILDVFSDRYLNAHLLYAVVDLLVVRLMPEMAAKGVQELRAERLDPFT